MTDRLESNTVSDVDPASGDRWPIKRLLSWTAERLLKQGLESPRLDAEVLLAHALGCERVRLYTRFDEEIEPSKRAAFRELIKRRLLDEPVAYLVGRKEFFSLSFAVSRSVLIPRPDSEYVVVAFLDAFKEDKDVRAVDVGTGSGCLALACLSHHKDARFLAIDASADALATAETNARTLKLSDRVEFRRGDLLEPVKSDGPFDAIISNPPYIPTAEIDRLDPCVREHEPRPALDGGADGLRVIERLIAQAAPLLKPRGRLIFEIGAGQDETVQMMIAPTRPGMAQDRSRSRGHPSRRSRAKNELRRIDQNGHLWRFYLDKRLPSGLPSSPWSISLSRPLDLEREENMSEFVEHTKLGEGGFGEVYVCAEGNESFALKKLSLNCSEDAESRFQREIRILSTLDHPNIVKVLSHQWETRPFYYIMPLYECSLEQERVKIHHHEDRANKIFRAVLDGMEYAHEQGVVHRDLKPANILMNNDDDVVISDFGLGRFTDSETTRFTQTGHGLGSYFYMAPEQHYDGKNADRRSDIFALGRILYVMHVGALIPLVSTFPSALRRPSDYQQMLPQRP